MKRLRVITAGVLWLSAVAACSVFDDQSPEFLSVRMTGSAGTEVVAIFSQVFAAGINEVGVTEVRVFSSDTVMTVLPLDTILDIAASRQLFLQLGPVMESDTLDVDVVIDVDDRNLVASSGLVFPLSPWRYVYQFNRPLTQNIEVIF